MSRKIVSVPPSRPIAQVVGLMRTQAIRHLLVLDGEHLVGIVSNRDVRVLLVDGEPRVRPDSPVRQVMTEHPITVGPDASLTEAARALLDHRIGALPVVEEERVVGILTRADALEALLTWAERSRAAGS
jgi:acetoin utilization protein AcuB